jgi:hypothetical protein
MDNIQYQMSQKIFLYSSNLAAFIGKNPHIPASRIFNSLYEKYYKVGKTVGDSEKIQKIGEKIENKKLLVEIDTICNNNKSPEMMQKDREVLIKSLETSSALPEEDKKVRKIVEGYTNKKFGTIREVNALDFYREKYNIEVITKIDQRSKKILTIDGVEIWVISKLDGMKMDGTVIEIKNRIYKLFDEVREYEWLQVQAYLHVYGLPKAELVEFLQNSGGTMKINEVERDETYWNEVLLKILGDYFRVFLKIIGNEAKIRKYMKFGETEQNEYIKKLVRKESIEKSE